ncbi:MAG: HD domain-containing phosphohydrolase [Clostridiales bacterium]
MEKVKTNDKLLKTKLLILDEKIDFYKKLNNSLNSNNYDSLYVKNPIKVLEKLRLYNIDILLVDLGTPNLNLLIEQIREFNQDIYIILLIDLEKTIFPMKLIRELDVQAFCKKTSKFDEVLASIELANKYIEKNQKKDKLLNMVPTIFKLKPVENVLESIMENLTYFADVKNAFLILDIYDKNYNEVRVFYKGTGFYNSSLHDYKKKISSIILKEINFVKNYKRSSYLKNGVILPLLENDISIGALYLEDIEVDKDEMNIMENYTKYIITSIRNSFQNFEISNHNRKLSKRNYELRGRYLDTIQALRMAVDAKDIFTRGHSDRVGFYAKRIGKEFGLSRKELELLRIGGIFHDIGKIGTSDDILLKNGKLTYHEYEEVKKHPEKGANILSAVSMFKDIVPLILYHHERIDGQGYPKGLKRDEIPFLARIITVADAFDAMMSNRKYRTKLDIEDTVKQLLAGAGTQFDERVVRKFLTILDDYDKLEGEMNDNLECENLRYKSLCKRTIKV